MISFVLTCVSSETRGRSWCQSSREENLIPGNQNLYNDNGPEFYRIEKVYFHPYLGGGGGGQEQLT